MVFLHVELFFPPLAAPGVMRATAAPRWISRALHGIPCSTRQPWFRLTTLRMGFLGAQSSPILRRSESGSSFTLPVDRHGEIQRHPTLAHHLPAWTQRLDLPSRAGGLAGSGRAGGLSLEQASRFQRAPDGLAARPGRAPLRRGRARRLHPAPGRRHLVRPRAGAHHHRAAEPGGHACRVRPDPRDLAARGVPHGLPLPRGNRGAHGPGPWPQADHGRHQ